MGGSTGRELVGLWVGEVRSPEGRVELEVEGLFCWLKESKNVRVLIVEEQIATEMFVHWCLPGGLPARLL